jgi:hypothetical protein
MLVKNTSIANKTTLFSVLIERPVLHISFDINKHAAFGTHASVHYKLLYQRSLRLDL